MTQVAIWENRHVEVLELTAHAAKIRYNEDGLEWEEYVPRSEIEELEEQE